PFRCMFAGECIFAGGKLQPLPYIFAGEKHICRGETPAPPLHVCRGNSLPFRCMFAGECIFARG
ncbi:hypothetical protein, partial [Providencia sp. PROV194]|uniref:hypothetical protein n=1 Tax=Providencia sp. PROV194 TaxID=2949895 RepID=UPI00234A55DB